MVQPTALEVALSLAESPPLVRLVRSSPLPDGIKLLLRVAANETEALRTAQAMTGRSQALLREAACFFIDQVLFHADADSYRILGAASGAPRSELRANMALLIKWLHPDGQARRASRSDFNRSAYLHRVSQAWENLKTDERRAAYDRWLSNRPGQPSSRHAARREQKGGRSANGRPPVPAGRTGEKATTRRLVIHRFDGGTLWSRLLTYLWVRP